MGSDSPVLGEEANHRDANGVGGGEAEAVRTPAQAWVLIREESKRLWGIGIPIAINTICLYSLLSLTQVFVGHLGNLELSGVSIGLTVLSSFSFGFLLGMGSALETLCGQAFGAGQVAMLGVYLQRSWIILLVTAVLMVPFYVFATPLLILIGQDEAVSQEAGKFSLYIIPVLFAQAINMPAGKFLQAQGKVVVLAWIGCAGVLFHALILYLFIYVFGWGLVGSGVAYSVSWWLVTLAQVIYVIGWCKDGWRGFSMAAFNDLWGFVKLSVASAVMLCLDVWYSSLLTVLTGNLADPEIAVDSISICMSINGWEAMIFIGLNAAVGVRVSNELGSGHPRKAMHAITIAVVESLALGLIAMAIILVTRNDFPIIFTTDMALRRAVVKLVGFLGVTMVLNSVQPVIQGVAVGTGWQATVAYINLGSYYLFGLPLGFLFGYKFNFGVEGIWAGMIGGILLQTLILLIVVVRTDWKAEAAQASARIRTWGGHRQTEPLLE